MPIPSTIAAFTQAFETRHPEVSAHTRGYLERNRARMHARFDTPEPIPHLNQQTPPVSVSWRLRDRFQSVVESLDAEAEAEAIAADRARLAREAERIKADELQTQQPPVRVR